MHARRLLRDERNGPRRVARRRAGDAAAGTRRGSGASCRLRRQSFRCEEPHRFDAQDRIPARHSAQRRRGRDRPGGRRGFAVAGGRARLGLERPVATPLRDRGHIDRAAVGTGRAAARQYRHGGRRLSRHSGLYRLSGGPAHGHRGRLDRAHRRGRGRRRSLRHPVREEAQSHRHHHRQLAGQGRDRAALWPSPENAASMR